MDEQLLVISHALPVFRFLDVDVGRKPFSHLVEGAKEQNACPARFQSRAYPFRNKGIPLSEQETLDQLVSGDRYELCSC